MIKIYRIIDNTNDNVYIGKTKQKYLSSRLSQHKYDYNINNNNSCLSREIIKNDDYKIELIEETDDESRERYWIENTLCINKQKPGRTHKEWLNDNKEKIKNSKRDYYEFRCSWGGDKRYQNNLLKIDPNLFL